MNGYESYLENLLELKEQEIKMYKNFIESELKCKIQEVVTSNMICDKNGVKEVQYKIVTIPQSQYIVQLNNELRWR